MVVLRSSGPACAQVLAEIPIVKCWMPPALSPSELCAAHIVLNLPIVDALRAACERTGPFSHAKTAEAERVV